MMISYGADYTLLIVLGGAILLGFTAGILGVFAVLRGQSLMGDAISHAMLPGIVAAFMVTHSKNPLILLTGGALAGILGMWCVRIIISYSRLKRDTALGIILSAFFGFGLLLMTKIQKQPLANQAILNKFLFGSASTLLFFDISVIALGSITALIFLMLFFKEFLLISFDLLFETVTAFTSEGLTFGVTSTLTAAGKILIMATLLMGRVGSFTLVLAFKLRNKKETSEFTYPEERIMLG